jgi:filamentous hemagglutinin family protein
MYCTSRPIQKILMTTKFWLSFLTLTTVLLSVSSVQAQTYQPSNRIPIADNTLGTQLSGAGSNFNITGGLSKGQTLFHSFTDFSVPTNGSANFLNPVGNRDIITRVTGSLFSDINGLVKTNGANFFLINPNGIVFGTGAQLNVGKAFVGSTASSLDLVDGGGRTITFGANPNGDAPLLSVAPNVLFNVSRLNLGGGNGAISNFGTLQTNNDSQYIGLIGGNVTLDGSSGGGKIIAPGGRVDIGGLSGAGSVSVDNSGLVFGGNGLGRSNVLLTNGAGITVRATGTLDTVNTFFNNATAPGSSLNISANNLDILNSGAKSNTLPAALDAGLETNSGVQTVAAGDININVIGKVNLNNSSIKNTLRSGSEGNIGDIKIQADTLDIKNQSIISSENTGGKGNAGNIDIKTTGDLRITGINYSALSPNDFANNVTGMSSSTNGQGMTGKITINTQGNMILSDQASIESRIDPQGNGNGQGVSINTKNLSLSNGSTISSENAGGQGNAGNLDIKTTGDLTIAGINSSALAPNSLVNTVTGMSSSTNGQGTTGKITINTQGNMVLSDQASIESRIDPQGNGNGQGVSINTKNLSLSNGSSISSENVGGQGNAGNIDISSQRDINLISKSSISSSSLGQGEAANILFAGNRFSLNDSSIFAQADSAKGGNIQFAFNDKFLLTTNSNISTNSGSTGKNGSGGNITINSPVIVATPGNNNISANAYAGNGGQVNITSQGVFGIQYRSVGSNATNDITASSTFGQNGAVNISTPGTDPGKDSAELPKVTTDASNQISQVCSADNRQNKLTVTGRGGLPPNASDPLTSDVIWQDARAAGIQPTASTTTNPAKLAPPAVGWVFNGKGKVTLVAAGTQGQPTRTSVVCP